MIDGGFFLVARKLFESELMDKPDLYVKLWLWMLNKANWKDHRKLKRGQFLTTIKEMREAMSYKVGYCTKTPTVGQIRSAYEAFTNSTMINTTKTTRGMIITIINYDTYQNPASYEQHNERHSEADMNNTITTHYKGKKGKKEKRDTGDPSGSPGPRPKECSSEQWGNFMVFSKQFLERQHDRLGKLVKTTDSRVLSGAKALDNLIRVQKFEQKVVFETVEWAMTNSFWQTNLLSLGSLTKNSRNGESKFTNILAARFKGVSDAHRINS
ncbi:hypothetical protein [Pseudodesulfovibrio sediminis]|uniref:Uncharacterized protein n=1 Tax=Pseudodesulfovibrio sediminis TaxID=2810563 RepID=A0ABM7P227_9BACT|nr:hypothetical protein [Pseudodesulfovibrio sediminis]BCS86835.1 hypothetical protein PSDVSF_00770 [Pseudodesulfovibrio sediminis]